VVGGGPAGITLARELAHARLDVCLLESGGLSVNATARRLAGGQTSGTPYYPLDRARARGFGGTSSLWFANVGLRCRPLDASDFARRPWIADSGWPFGSDELGPYYQRAQAVLGLGPFEYSAAAWETCATPRLRLCEGDVDTTVFQLADTRSFRNYLPELARATNVRLVLNATVLEIETGDDATRVSGLRVATLEGRHFCAQARAYVLSAGGIENARLLLLSRSSHRKGIGNQDDLVGRYFMEHIHVNSGFIRPIDGTSLPNMSFYANHWHRCSKVAGALTITPEVQQRESVASFSAVLHTTSEASARSRGVRSIRRLWVMAREGLLNRTAAGHVRNVLVQFRDVAAFAGRRLTPSRRSGSQHVTELGVMSEQVPNRESRVLLAPERDLFGQPKALLEWRLCDQDYNTIIAGQDAFDRELRRAGIGRLESKYADEEPRPTLGGGWHHMGTTRMHQDPAHGVVDADCKVHGMKNLFVAGSSVFPTGGFANPTLTIVAMAMRLADHLQHFLTFGGPI
jgi:choline dehydrogenase-like flavoprotein